MSRLKSKVVTFSLAWWKKTCSRESQKESCNTEVRRITAIGSRRSHSASEDNSSRQGLVSSCHPCQAWCSWESFELLPQEVQGLARHRSRTPSHSVRKPPCRLVQALVEEEVAPPAVPLEPWLAQYMSLVGHF